MIHASIAYIIRGRSVLLMRGNTLPRFSSDDASIPTKLACPTNGNKTTVCVQTGPYAKETSSRLQGGAILVLLMPPTEHEGIPTRSQTSKVGLTVPLRIV
jgi:hypothetical protein